MVASNFAPSLACVNVHEGGLLHAFSHMPDCGIDVIS